MSKVSCCGVTGCGTEESYSERLNRSARFSRRVKQRGLRSMRNAAMGTLEQLEQRRLLTATLSKDVFAELKSDVPMAGMSASIPVSFSNSLFTLAGGRSLVGLEVSAASGSTLDPDATEVLDSTGKVISPIVALKNAGAQGGGKSYVVVDLAAGSYNLRVKGESGRGGFTLNVSLVGDVDGSRGVDRTDSNLLRGAFGKKLGQAGYVPEADINRDGVINSQDQSLLSRNLSDATTVKPLTLTGTLDAVPAGFGTTLEDGSVITRLTSLGLGGTSLPGVTVQLETDGGGFKEGQTSAGPDGAYRLTVDLGQERVYPVLAKASDSFGQVRLLNFSITADRTAPTLVDSTPKPNAQISGELGLVTLTYSEALDTSRLTAAGNAAFSASKLGGSAADATSVSTDATGKQIQIEFGDLLKGDYTLTSTSGAVADLAGNVASTALNFTLLTLNDNDLYPDLVRSTVATVGLNPIFVTSADVDKDGDADLIVANYGTQFNRGKTISVLRNIGNNTFNLQATYTVGDYPISIATTDIDNDADIDILVACVSGGLFLLRNNGNGIFANGINTGIISNLSYVITADLDRDNKPDTIAAERSHKSISIQFGNGFTGHIGNRYDIEGLPRYITSADLDNDGDIDIVTANYSSSSLSILRNQGDGKFDPQVAYSLPSSVVSLIAEDFDRDGDVDIVTAHSGSNILSVMMNNGDMTFSPQINYNIGFSPSSMTAVDIDNDGDKDLMAVSSLHNTLSVIKNNGGVLKDITSYVTKHLPRHVSWLDIDNDGDADPVFASNSNNIINNIVVVLFNNGHGTIDAPIAHTIGSSPTSIISEDLDGDGDADVVTTNYSSNTISVLRNNGYETFDVQVPYETGRGPISIASGDIDGDNDIDLIVANRFNSNAGNSVSVFRNNGNGTFASRINYPVETRPNFVTSADIDGDNDIDIITSSSFTNSYVSILRNKGDGTFFPFAAHPVNNTVISVKAEDFDQDGDIDIVTASGASIHPDNTISVLINRGGGSFAPFRTYFGINAAPIALTTVDLDSDGDIDLVTGDSSASGAISFHRNNGNGTFANAVRISSGLAHNSFNAADVDGDGDIDLISSTSGSYYNLGSTIRILKNDGNGTFSTGYSLVTRIIARRITVLDIDSDGDVDLITADNVNGTVSILRNNGNGIFFARSEHSIGTKPNSIYSSDIDADNDVDLVIANSGTPTASGNTVSVLRNLGDGAFAVHVTYVVGTRPLSVRTADVDGDGDADLITANSGSNTVSLLRNNGNGTFATQITYATGTSPFSVTAADVDADGDADLITANSSSNSVSVLTNNGNGTFATQVSYATGSNSNPRSVTTTDVDGDGDADLITANSSSNSVSVLRNNGNGTFATQVSYATGSNSNPRSVTTTDVDGDGDADLIVANYSSNTVSVLRNNGNGIFAAQVAYSAGSAPNSVTTTDLDRDGDVDLVVTNPFSNTVSILRNNGDGIFGRRSSYLVGLRPNSLSLADFDGDGDFDIATANYEGNSVSILPNQTLQPKAKASSGKEIPADGVTPKVPVLTNQPRQIMPGVLPNKTGLSAGGVSTGIAVSTSIATNTSTTSSPAAGESTKPPVAVVTSAVRANPFSSSTKSVFGALPVSATPAIDVAAVTAANLSTLFPGLVDPDDTALLLGTVTGAASRGVVFA